VSGAGGLNEGLTVSYTDNINAGTATASASYAESANYLGSSDSETFAIAKAATITTVTCPAGPYTYTGAAQTPCSASVTGPGSLNQTLTVNYTDNVNAGTAHASASYTESANYLASSDSETFAIGKANANIHVTPYSVPHDGNPHTATGTAVGVASDNLYSLLDLSGTTHTNIGNYLGDVWTFAGNNNYNASNGTVNDQITYLTGTCVGQPGHQILSPISPSMTTPSTAKKSSTVPAKFRVCDAAGHSIGTPGVVTNFAIVYAVAGTTQDTILDIQSTTPDTAFRWDPTNQQWIFNISTKNLGVGVTYTFQIDLNDGTNIMFKLGVK
jgi:hypothetical protein